MKRQSEAIRLADRFTLLRELGRGGTSVVYLADDEQAGRCAVKVLLPELASRADLRHRFAAEARAMASLRHPAVLRVLAWGTGELGPYLVTDFAEGGSVAAWVRRHGPMPGRMAVSIALQTCEGVAAAHALGIVHRDVKPDNVLLAADGSCRVCDFGIALVRQEAQRITRTGTSLGTRGFMAPEQVEQARDVDARADVYGIATTLWFLLTGSLPAHVFKADPWDSGVPGPLVPILARATAYRRDERFADVATLALELDKVMPRLPPLPADTPPVAPLPATLPDAFGPPTGPSDEPEHTWVDDP